MFALSDLERAVLSAIATQVPEHAQALLDQIASAHVVERENTGTGFYAKLAITAGRKMHGAPSPLGDIGADIDGIEHGMGFLLWLQDGMAHTLEGYTYEETTLGLDLDRAAFSGVGPRLI